MQFKPSVRFFKSALVRSLDCSYTWSNLGNSSNCVYLSYYLLLRKQLVAQIIITMLLPKFPLVEGNHDSNTNDITKTHSLVPLSLSWCTVFLCNKMYFLFSPVKVGLVCSLDFLQCFNHSYFFCCRQLLL